VADRYARHALVPGWDQSALARAEVVVVGVGALGTEVARLLGQAGVGRLVLCDPDVVSESNLSRGALFRAADVGRPKVDAAAEALAATAPDTVVDPRHAELAAAVGLGELRSASLVVSCLDSLAARLRLTTRCNLVGVPLLDGGTSPWGGEVRYHAADDACFGCGLSAADRAATDDPWSCADLARPREFGASAPISALVASWMATTALRRLFGVRTGTTVVRIDPVGGSAHPVRVDRDPECPLHETVTEVFPVEHDHFGTTGELLGAVSGDEVALTWTPFPVAEGRTSVHLRDAPPDARLADLGVAPRELLPVVTPGSAGRLRYLELAPTGEGAP
jgi:molybdopterin/thiamine biosynthesis adenylyltransferase